VTAFKVSKFLGKAPRISPELLPDAAAQIASNAKVSSGDLIPYRIPTIVGNVNRNGDIKTIYPMRDTSDPTINRWLSWLTDVDVAVTTTLNDEEQRIYYTGDGVPKVTNYALAVDGSGVYPAAYYDLGLPLPTTIPVTSATSYTSKTITSYARDSGNTATIITSSNHSLNTGQRVTIAGFTSAVGKLFNITNAQVTVIDNTTFTYYSVGAAVGTSSESGGTANLAGNTNTRNYIYTWVTPWGEESIPSDLSETLYVKEGQTITVSNLPTAPPAGDNFITGFRLYRTITSSSGSDYFRVRTVWFPISLVQASRTSNTVTMKVSEHHNLLVGDKIKISGTTFSTGADATFDVTDVTVQSVVDEYSFTYLAAGSNKATTACTAGTLYWDISEPETTDSRYYESSTFTDDYDVNGLTTLLSSLYYDAPDADMKGLITAQNNILVGFVGNELCFSEPGKPWAWPIKYRLIFDSPIVAISPIAGSIIVLTNSYPHLVSGSTPANMASARIDAPFPCTSKRGVVNVGYGVVFPTFGGLGIYNPSAGIDIVTKLIYDWDAWGTELDSTTITAAFYAGKYFASHSAGSFIFEREDKVGGFFIDTPIDFSAAYYDSKYNNFYYISDQSGTLSEWDKLGTELQQLEWKSKVIVTKDYINLGAARVVGDYSTPTEDTEIIVANNLLVPAINTALFALVTELGTLNGPTSATLTTSGALNTMQVNGDPFFTSDITAAYAQNITANTPTLTTALKEVTGSYPVSFRLWANKQLVCNVTVADSNIFRLPPGYRADTFEFAVTGSARIRAIHVGETPFGLRTT